jgi:4-amino-4-deoxy-L-arabinose transferase-like glycosyltransferase
MTAPLQKSFARFSVLFLALTIFLTFAIGQRGLSEPDEGRYTAMAQEMLEPDANWLEPRLSDFGHYDKPPLIYWATALSLKCFGATESAARLPSALGAILTLASLCWAAWRLYGREVAWWSVLICGTLGQFWLLARFLSPDMLLTAWCTLAIAAWAEARHRNGHLGFWFLSLFFWTLAWWTKATASLVPLLGLITAIWFTKDSAGKQALRPWRMLAGILVLGSPWYLLMMHRHPDLTRFFFGHELVGRIAGDEHRRHKPFYFFLLTSWFLWMPWLPMLAAVTFFQRKTFSKITRARIRSALGWDGWIVVAGLLILSINSSKLLSYTLPLAPWIAVGLARTLMRAKTFLSENAFRRMTYGGPTFIAIVALFAVVFWPKFEGQIGNNSSLRPVALRLKAKGVRTVLLDKYWPSMEFYLGEEVYYVGKKPPQQSDGDLGICAEIGESHFCPVAQVDQKIQSFSSSDVWFVHFLPGNNSTFDALEKQYRFLDREKIGDFELLRIDSDSRRQLLSSRQTN